ncbi:MAG: hypothetical protein IPL31_01135 [Saprospiraceae bacterium]|nr:hypothetical protein [Saprospiraceae bacterium]
MRINLTYMKGVSYLTDESNEKVAVQIDLKRTKNFGKIFAIILLLQKENWNHPKIG